MGEGACQAANRGRWLVATLLAAAALAAWVVPASRALAQPGGGLPARGSVQAPLVPPANGPRRMDPMWVALTDLTVHVDAERTLSRATLVLRDGRISAVLPAQPGPDGQPNTADDVPPRLPLGPRVVPATGMHAYPAFIDAFVEVDAPAPDGTRAELHWNAHVTPQRRALDGSGVDDATARRLRELGFGAAAISPRGNVFAGLSAVVSLAKPSDDASIARPPVYRENVYQTVALDTAGRGYPDSQMGAIALVRQTLADAQWLSNHRAGPGKNEPQTALDALLPLSGGPPMLCVAEDELESLRVAKVMREFSRSAMLLGHGNEFARLEAIRSDGLPIVLPLRFPRAPDVASPGKADAAELRDMMRWEQAPTNPRRLLGAGVTVALTSSLLRDRGDFMPNLRKAIQHGLTEKQALAALTTTPARLLGVEEQLGTLEVGKRANVLVTSGPVFERRTKRRMIFVDGVQHNLELEQPNLDGTWKLDGTFSDGAERSMVITGDEVTVVKVPAPLPPDAQKPDAQKPDASKPDAQVPDEAKPEAAPAAPKPIRVQARKVVREQGMLTFVFDHDRFGTEGVATVVLNFELRATPPRAEGRLALPDGRELQLKLVRQPDALTGVWPIALEAGALGEGQMGPTLIFEPGEEGGTPKVSLREASGFDAVPAGEVRLENFAYGVEWARFELVRTIPAEGAAPQRSERTRVELTPDFAPTRLVPAQPATARGVLITEGGSRLAFSSVRREANPFVGRWRVNRMDDSPTTIAPDAPEQVRLRIGSRSVTVTRTRAGQPDASVDAREEAFKEGVLTFEHALRPLGFTTFAEGNDTSKDRVTLRLGASPAQDVLLGTATLPDGSTHRYQAVRVPSGEDDDDDRAPTDIPEKLPVPFGPFGFTDGSPAQGAFVLTGGTLWTNTDAGIIPNGTVVIENGRIVYAGAGPVPGPLPAGATTIDCRGKHITPGIIDAHSHTGISKGVNEGGMAITAQVRIEDVTNPDDVNWYRQLAAGVTSVLSLHGSANAIGGQSQVNKLRWGCARPDDMHMQGAPPGIKFALGENPRQVNWGLPGNERTRYPQTRMGVETLIRDRFTAAREYAMDTSPNKRRDLQLEALAEILAGKRLIHCHSYRQDEIVMLTQIARDFGFRIGTFQHVLEGYKVADYLRDYSGGGSGFADWWNFKVEVQDAIPAAFPLMEKAGAVVSYNSDSNNLARFMNVEAAKAVKYGREVGGVLPEAAFKYVTLNPARQLRIDDQVGSLRAGLVADVAVWSADPLSVYARCERTFVDGRQLFSLEDDARLRERVSRERQRLITKLLADRRRSASDDASPSASSGPRQHGHDAPARGLSEQQIRMIRLRHLELLRSGKDPFFAPGVCGCDVTAEQNIQ